MACESTGTDENYHMAGPDRRASLTASEHSASFRWRRTAWAGLVAITLAAAATVPVSANTGGGTGFTDVPEGGTHEPAIKALAEMGVFEGTECGDGLFCPVAPVERWVMAVWLVRVLGGEGDTTGTSRFADVDADRWWSPHAEELANREITAGCKTGPLRYCPDKTVNRAQMASFLVRAFDLDPTESSAGFADVSEGSTHGANIEALFAAGITAGCQDQGDPLRYCPQKAVKRGQMATFLHRAFLKQQAAESGAVEISDDVPDVDLTDMSTGDTVNLRSVFTGDKAVMFWFWAEW